MRTIFALALACLITAAPARAEGAFPGPFAGPGTTFGMAQDINRLVAVLGDDVLRDLICRLAHERYSPRSLGSALNIPSGDVMRRIDTLRGWGLARMVSSNRGAMVVEGVPGVGTQTLRRWADKYCPVGAMCGMSITPPPPTELVERRNVEKSFAPGGADDPSGRESILYMDLKHGRVVIRLHPELAPRHCARIKQLVRRGFYDGLTFHRVIEGFMAQGGDPTGDGTGGSGSNIRAEFKTKGLSHKRGIVSMARAQNPDSADSQFFIMLADNPQLDGQYSIWGEVIEGIKYVDKIKKGDPSRNGVVQNPDKIIRMRVASDVRD